MAKSTKKVAVKKAPVKKAPAKKTPVKKAPAKKTPVKKAPAKKPSARKAPVRRKDEWKPGQAIPLSLQRQMVATAVSTAWILENFDLDARKLLADAVDAFIDEQDLDDHPGAGTLWIAVQSLVEALTTAGFIEPKTTRNEAFALATTAVILATHGLYVLDESNIDD